MGAVEIVNKDKQTAAKEKKDEAPSSAATKSKEERKDKASEVKDRVVEAGKAVVNRAKDAVRPRLTKDLMRRIHRLLHLSLGALALLNDERKSLTQRCISRGEEVESETREATQKLFQELKRMARREKEELEEERKSA